MGWYVVNWKQKRNEENDRAFRFLAQQSGRARSLIVITITVLSFFSSLNELKIMSFLKKICFVVNQLNDYKKGIASRLCSSPQTRSSRSRCSISSVRCRVSSVTWSPFMHWAPSQGSVRDVGEFTWRWGMLWLLGRVALFLGVRKGCHWVWIAQRQEERKHLTTTGLKIKYLLSEYVV